METTNILRIEDAVKQVLETATNCEMQNIPTGFQVLDALTKGWFPGEFCIIGGRPMMGKSAFVISAMGYLLRQKIPVLFLSATDVLNKELITRLMSSIKRQKVDCDALTDVDSSDIPLYLNLRTDLTLAYIKENAQTCVKDYGVKCIFIETIQSVFDSENDGNTKEGMEKICHELKMLARELNIPLIMTSDLNRGTEYRDGMEGKRPQMQDLRGSGCIENTADSVYLLFRPAYYQVFCDEMGRDLRNTMEVIVAKKKYGCTGEVKLYYDLTTGLIKDFHTNI